MLPAASFIDVGKNLYRDDLSTYQFSSGLNLLLGHGEEESKMSYMSVRSKGTLIIEGLESREFNVESVDIDAYNEMYYGTFHCREFNVESVDIDAYNEMYRNLSRKNRIFNVITCVLSIIILYLGYQLYLVGRREGLLVYELLKVEQEKGRLLDLTLNNNMNKCSNDSQLSLFELNSCFFKVQTSASLGECGKNLKQDIIDWYDKVIYDAYSSWWDDIFHAEEEDDAFDRESAAVYINDEGNTYQSGENDWTDYLADFV